MAIRTYKVTLDSKNTIAPEPVYLRQGDKTGAVVIDATLMDNGSPVSLSGLTPMFKANTADGQAVIVDSTGFNIVNASGGEFTYQVPSQLGSVDGKIKIAYFSFSDSSGSQSTFNVVFVVEKAADMTQESAKDWVSTLSEIIEQYNQWANDAHSSWEQFVNDNKAIIESIDPGGTLLAEVVAARKPDGKPTFKSLGERLNNMPFNEYFKNNDQTGSYDVGGGIVAPDELKAFNDAIDDSKFNVVFQTDVHNELYSDYRPHMDSGLRHTLNAMYLKDKVNAIVFNGDNINNGGGYDDKSKAIKLMDDFVTTVWSASDNNTPVFINKGNHDNNYRDRTVWGESNWKTPLEDVITNAQFAKYFKYNGQYGEVRSNGSAYCYKDFDDKNIRLICLDSYDLPEVVGTDGKLTFDGRHWSILSINQLQWLVETLKTTKHVMVFTHNPIGGTFVPFNETETVNHDLLKQILEAFVAGGSGSITGLNGTINYEFGEAGNLVGVFTGHLHQDGVKVVNNIQYAQTTCSAVYADFGHEDRASFYGTAKEDVMDVIEIDTSNRSVKLKRWGYGADRMFNY